MRLSSLPVLPVTEALPRLSDALAGNRRVLLQAPPGAGKSTLVPLALLESAWLADRKILMLEPRRIAARAVAQRMAYLLGEPVGATVGFRTGLETRVGRNTRVEVITEGILTRMLQSDSELRGIGCVIFDEFHERSLHADLGLALCIESQDNLREDLRLLIMSATLDLAPLSKLLGDIPCISSAGRSFEVKTIYLPRRAELALERHASQVLRKALKDGGDILCFLPGAAEIGRVQRALDENPEAGVTVLPLYGDLTGAAQDAALSPPPEGRRKIVLATSIAETSLTIEGIRVVVDAGLRRHAEFDPATGMSRLVTGKVSQSAADQRRGRAGRLSAGVCYRLWSEGTQQSLSPQTEPEIRHADLAPLALELSCWGASDAYALTWLDPPPAAHLAQARDLLRQLEAIDQDNRITAHGRAMADAGTHPRLAHMMIKGRSLGAAGLAADLAAVLGERDLLRADVNARDADLRMRVGALRGGGRALPPGFTLDRRAQQQALRNADKWRREFSASADTVDAHRWTGILAAHAYPDRIGRRRGDGGRYVLANGRGAFFAEAQALSKSEFIVAAELDAGEREARIFLAAPIEAEDIARHFAAHITEHSEIEWDGRAQAVLARRERRLGAIVLESSDIRDPDAAQVQRALLVGIRQLGLSALPWTPALRQWQARVQLMRHHAVKAPEPWPDLGDEALGARMEEWAPPWLTGISRREHLTRLDLGNALRTHLSYAQSAILEREAPTHYTVPSGSHIPIDYLDGEDPTLSVRLQEMFGLTATPAVAAGRAPLLLKLLSPAHRPVQITRDLVSFWSRGYHDVKKDLKGRYPKHFWPDDPTSAQPTRRARPR